MDKMLTHGLPTNDISAFVLFCSFFLSRAKKRGGRSLVQYPLTTFSLFAMQVLVPGVHSTHAQWGNQFWAEISRAKSLVHMTMHDKKVIQDKSKTRQIQGIHPVLTLHLMICHSKKCHRPCTKTSEVPPHIGVDSKQKHAEDQPKYSVPPRCFL